MPDLKVICDRIEVLKKTIELCQILKAVQKEVSGALSSIRSGSERTADLFVLKQSRALAQEVSELSEKVFWLWRVSVIFPKRDSVEEILERAERLLERIQSAKSGFESFDSDPKKAFSEGVSAALSAGRLLGLIDEILKGLDEAEKRKALERLEAEKETLYRETLKKLSSPSRIDSKKVL